MQNFIMFKFVIHVHVIRPQCISHDFISPERSVMGQH